MVQEIDALENTETQHGHLMALMRHRAMLAAAPQPPTAEKSSGVEQPQSVTDCHQSQPQGEQEPVAWMWSSNDGTPSSVTFGGPNSNTPKDWIVQPLYTRPQPKRKPLTDEQISDELNFAIETPTQAERAAFRKGIKLAERAHKIGGEA